MLQKIPKTASNHQYNQRITAAMSMFLKHESVGVEVTMTEGDDRLAPARGRVARSRQSDYGLDLRTSLDTSSFASQFSPPLRRITEMLCRSVLSFAFYGTGGANRG